MKTIYETSLLPSLQPSDPSTELPELRSESYHLQFASFINTALYDAVKNMKSEDESKDEKTFERVPLDDLITLFHKVLNALNEISPSLKRSNVAIYQYNLSMLLLARSHPASQAFKKLKEQLLQEAHPSRDEDSIALQQAIQKMLSQRFVPATPLAGCALSQCKDALETYLSVPDKNLSVQDKKNIFIIGRKVMTASSRLGQEDKSLLIKLVDYLDRRYQKMDRHWNLLLVAASHILKISTDMQESSFYATKIENILNIIPPDGFDFKYSLIYSELIQFHLRRNDDKKNDLMLAEKLRVDAIASLMLIEQTSELPYFATTLRESIVDLTRKQAESTVAATTTSTASIPLNNASAEHQSTPEVKAPQRDIPAFMYPNTKRAKVERVDNNPECENEAMQLR